MKTVNVNKWFTLSLAAVAIFSLASCNDEDDDMDEEACTETTWYQDADEDGLGDPDVSMMACEQPEGFVENSDDDDDTDDGTEEVAECVQREIVDGPGECTVFSDIEPAVTFSIDEDNNLRIIESNSIPEHTMGTFRNQTVSAQQENYQITTEPVFASEMTSLQGDNGPEYIFGILLNGVELDPIAAEPWPHSGDLMDEDNNWDWNLEALTAPIGLDCNYAHVQPSGKYHYHGSPTEFDLIKEADGSSMVHVGWAADGYPIYYKYAYETADDASSQVVEMTASYQIKEGNRDGDGITGPCSEYNGAYSADYEYIDGLGILDETNGRTGVTPEFPEGTYYYVLTDGDSFPSIPRFFRGTPSDDFRQGGGGMGGGMGGN